VPTVVVTVDAIPGDEVLIGRYETLFLADALMPSGLMGFFSFVYVST
jgi:hypothetical protein